MKYPACSLRRGRPRAPLKPSPNESVRDHRPVAGFRRPGRGLGRARVPSVLRDPESGVEVAPGKLATLVGARPSESAAVVDRLGRFTESAATWGAIRLDEIDLTQIRRRILVADNEADLFAGPLREVICGARDRDEESIGGPFTRPWRRTSCAVCRAGSRPSTRRAATSPGASASASGRPGRCSPIPRCSSRSSPPRRSTHTPRRPSRPGCAPHGPAAPRSSPARHRSCWARRTPCTTSSTAP